MMSTAPAITADQMRQVDRLMISEFHIDLVQMMENAGRALAELAIDAFQPRTVVVLAGPGGNGGGGLVAARHLINRDRDVRVLLARPEQDLAPVPAHQLDILRRMSTTVIDTAGDPDLIGADLIIDALLGYSLTGNPREPTAALIESVNATETPVLSLDTPSGLNVTTGFAADPCVAATATLTLALPKVGLLGAGRVKHVGRLYLADISVPRALYRRMGIDVGPLFTDDSIVLLEG